MSWLLPIVRPLLRKQCTTQLLHPARIQSTTGNAEKRAQRSLESFKSPESSTTLSESSDLLDTTPSTIKSWWLLEARTTSPTMWLTFPSCRLRTMPCPCSLLFKFMQGFTLRTRLLNPRYLLQYPDSSSNINRLQSYSQGTH